MFFYQFTFSLLYKDSSVFRRVVVMMFTAALLIPQFFVLFVFRRVVIMMFTAALLIPQFFVLFVFRRVDVHRGSTDSPVLCAVCFQTGCDNDVHRGSTDSSVLCAV